MNKIKEIIKLKSLLDQGAIDDKEFQQLKQKILLAEQQPPTSRSKETENRKRKSKRKLGFRVTIIILIFISLLVLAYGYFNKGGVFEDRFNIFSTQRDNINSTDLDSIKLFDNIIYDNGEVAGSLITIDFYKESNKSGRVFNVPNNKMWTPLYFEYEDFGNNYRINIPEILTEQYEYDVAGRYWSYFNIYEDKETGIWWRTKSGFYFPEKKDFKTIKFSLRNNESISGKNAIYVRDNPDGVRYTLHFFEEPIQ